MIHIFTIAVAARPATTGRNPRLKSVGRSAFIRDTLGINSGGKAIGAKARVLAQVGAALLPGSV